MKLIATLNNELNYKQIIVINELLNFWQDLST